MKDWVGNKNANWKTIGASNHTDKEREKHDFYCTDPIAIDVLLDEGHAELAHRIWEPCCGNGSLSKRLEERGYKVYSTDLIDRGYGKGGCDFLSVKKENVWNGSIVTNPPYSLAYECIEQALKLVTLGNKVFMFLKIQFLEGKKRRKIFDTGQLKTLYVSSSRILCAKNGEFKKMKAGGGSAVAYGWYEFEKGYSGDPIIKWIN